MPYTDYTKKRGYEGAGNRGKVERSSFCAACRRSFEDGLSEMKCEAELNPPSCVALSCCRRRLLPACVVSNAGCSMQLPSNTTIDHNTDRMVSYTLSANSQASAALSGRSYTTRKHTRLYSFLFTPPAVASRERRQKTSPRAPATIVPTCRTGDTPIPF